MVLHLSQAGRLDVEQPPKKTKPRGSVVRLVFGDGDAGLDGEGIGILAREYGTQRKASWWVLAPGDDGPLAGLGPEPGSEAFAALIRTGDSRRHLTTDLRDQHVMAGIGRGWGDDILHRAKLSPFASLRSLTPEQREALLTAANDVLAEALELERTRQGGLSESKLGGRFKVHNRFGEPCPTPCGDTLGARLVRVLRNGLLPDVPDGRQGAGRPPPLPSPQIAGAVPRPRWCRRSVELAHDGDDLAEDRHLVGASKTIGSYAVLAGVSTTRPFLRLNVLTVASPSLMPATTTSPLSASGCWRTTT